jgi:hypothetical protein
MSELWAGLSVNYKLLPCTPTQAVTLMICIRKFVGSNLCRETGYPEHSLGLRKASRQIPRKRLTLNSLLPHPF